MTGSTLTRSSVALDVAREAAAVLSHAEAHGDGAFIRTPLLFPNGASVTVFLSGDGDGFQVSDYGFASSDAAMWGGGTAFETVAMRIAERSGISYEDGTFFAKGLARDQVPGAVATVANAAKEASDLAALNPEDATSARRPRSA
jgi:hypothetical protein